MDSVIPVDVFGIKLSGLYVQNTEKFGEWWFCLTQMQHNMFKTAHKDIPGTPVQKIVISGTTRYCSRSQSRPMSQVAAAQAEGSVVRFKCPHFDMMVTFAIGGQFLITNVTGNQTLLEKALKTALPEMRKTETDCVTQDCITMYENNVDEVVSMKRTTRAPQTGRQLLSRYYIEGLDPTGGGSGPGCWSIFFGGACPDAVDDKTLVRILKIRDAKRKRVYKQIHSTIQTLKDELSGQIVDTITTINQTLNGMISTSSSINKKIAMMLHSTSEAQSDISNYLKLFIQRQTYFNELTQKLNQLSRQRIITLSTIRSYSRLMSASYSCKAGVCDDVIRLVSEKDARLSEAKSLGTEVSPNVIYFKNKLVVTYLLPIKINSFQVQHFFKPLISIQDKCNGT